MIAEIQPSFSSSVVMVRKVAYQLTKIEQGDARVLFTSTGDALQNIPEYMQLIAGMNERVKLPYAEFILSLYPGETLTDKEWLSLANEYVNRMGYGECCYAVVLNTDKAHQHVHVLLTTVDEEGRSVPSGNNYRRSEKISRELERKYGLIPVENGHSAKATLGESHYRTYYFDAAMKKALRNHAYRDKVSSLLCHADALRSSGKPAQEITLSNEEWWVLLGDELYDDLFNVLEKGGFFKPLLKDELLHQLDRVYAFSENTADFRKNLEHEGLYMRLVTKKDKSYYVYGMKDTSFYVKDTSLPMKYRFGHIRFDGKGMSADEQKHYLYDHVFMALNGSGSYRQFKEKLEQEGIQVQEHENASGVYGISFGMSGIDSPQMFKGSDISRKLTYRNIQKHFDGMAAGMSPHIDRVGEFRERVERESMYMQHGSIPYIPDVDVTGGSKKPDEDDFIPSKKKKKRKNEQGFSL